jgi:hypothetical protein
VEEKGEGTVGKGKVYCADEGSANVQDIGNYLPISTSSGNLNLQQHRFESEISVITVGENGAVAPRNNLIIRVVKSIFVWNFGEFSTNDHKNGDNNLCCIIRKSSPNGPVLQARR